MNNYLHETLEKLWTKDVKKECERGLLTYERQVQAFIYHKLKGNRLTNKLIQGVLNSINP